jgi:hypothetical protein
VKRFITTLFSIFLFERNAAGKPYSDFLKKIRGTWSYGA